MSAHRAGPVSRVSRFLDAPFAGRSTDALWLPVSLLLGAVVSAAFLYKASGTGLSIHDDARMFLSWMSRWDDPTALAGDLMADYWFSVTPWFFSAFYHAAWRLGIEPVAFSKIVPALLFPLVALFAYRFLRAIRAEPAAAFLGAALLLLHFAHTDIVISATPRAFWPVLLLAILDGLARRSVWQTVIGQLALTGCYPQIALVAATVIGLTMIVPARRPRLDLGRRRLAIVGLAALASVAGLLPFLQDTTSYGHATTLEQARAIPAFQHGARGAVFKADGSLDLLCNRRGGIFGGTCESVLDPGLWLRILLIVAGPLVLLRRSLRQREDGPMSSPLPFYLLAATVVWSAAAALVLFRLHLPSRFSATVPLIVGLSTYPAAFEWLCGRSFVSRLRERRRRWLLIGAVAGVLALAAIAVSAVRTRLETPADPALLAAIERLPKDAVVAGFVGDLDFLPVFTRRSALFNRELAVAYQYGYFRQITERMEAIRDVHLTHDPAVLAERLERHGIDRLLIEESALATPGIPDSFRGFFGSDLSAREAVARTGGPTALARFAKPCTVGAYSSILVLDAGCLIGHARQPQSARGRSP